MAIEYDLEKTAEEQPPFSINEVFVITHHLVAGCDMLFPTVRVLFQLNTLRKMMVSTSAPVVDPINQKLTQSNNTTAMGG